VTIGPKFKDDDTERFANGERSRKLSGVPRTGLVRLERLYAATDLLDLRIPPGNRFEALHGDRAGQCSIRINDKWRICFNWSEERREAYNIEITDYH
jgi:proteic killer suppression protein